MMKDALIITGVGLSLMFFIFPLFVLILSVVENALHSKRN